MKLSKIKKQLKKENSIFYPDLKQNILNQIGYSKNKNVMYQNYSLKRLAFTFSFSILICLFFTSIIFKNNGNSNSYILIDYQASSSTLNNLYSKKSNSSNSNVSIELEIKKNKISTFRGLTIDGVLILEGYNNKILNLKTEDAINNILESSFNLNYLSKTSSNTVYLTVINETDQQKEDDLKEKTKDNFESYFLKNNYQINLKINEYSDKDYKKAEKNKLSCEKYDLIKNILKENPDLSFEKLKEYSVQELNELKHEYNKKRIDDTLNTVYNILINISKTATEQLNELLNTFNYLENKSLNILNIYQNKVNNPNYLIEINNELQSFPNEIKEEILKFIENDISPILYQIKIKEMLNKLYILNEQLYNTKLFAIIDGYKLLYKYNGYNTFLTEEIPISLNIDYYYDLDALDYNILNSTLCHCIVRLNTINELFINSNFNNLSSIIVNNYIALNEYIVSLNDDNLINSTFYEDFYNYFKNFS